MKKLLFVFNGNTCRSPMAEYAAQQLLEKEGLSDCFVTSSAGLAAAEGEPISPNALLALQQRGISANAHRARLLTLAEAEQAFRIYVMTAAHREVILHALPDAADKIKVLEIPDPYGIDLPAYQACLAAIDRFLEKELQALRAQADKGE